MPTNARTRRKCKTIDRSTGHDRPDYSIRFDRRLIAVPFGIRGIIDMFAVKKVDLGFALVLGFSVGLAIALVTVGSIAAISVKHANKKFKKLGEFARKIPYASSMLLILIGLLVATQGLRHLMK